MLLIYQTNKGAFDLFFFFFFGGAEQKGVGHVAEAEQVKLQLEQNHSPSLVSGWIRDESILILVLNIGPIWCSFTRTAPIQRSMIMDVILVYTVALMNRRHT